MNKSAASLAVILALVFASNAFALGEIQKAKDYIKVGMDNQAIGLLEKTIVDNPKNADAHMMLAELYLKQGNQNAAKARFNSVVALRPGMKKQIAEIYKKQAYAMASSDGYGAENLFKESVRLDSTATGDTYKFYLLLGSTAHSNYDALRYYSIAASYAKTPEQKKDIGMRLLPLAAKGSGVEKESRAKAVALLGQDFVDKLFPRPSSGETNIVVSKSKDFDVLNQNSRFLILKMKKSGEFRLLDYWNEKMTINFSYLTLGINPSFTSNGIAWSNYEPGFAWQPKGNVLFINGKADDTIVLSPRFIKGEQAPVLNGNGLGEPDGILVSKSQDFEVVKKNVRSLTIRLKKTGEILLLDYWDEVYTINFSVFPVGSKLSINTTGTLDWIPLVPGDDTHPKGNVLFVKGQEGDTIILTLKAEGSMDKK